MPPYKTGQKNPNETACETTDLDSCPLLRTNSLLSKRLFMMRKLTQYTQWEEDSNETNISAYTLGCFRKTLF